MSQTISLLTAARPPRAAAVRILELTRRAGGAAPRRVREWSPDDGPARAPRFEGEGSQRLSIGSVAVADGCWWSAVLAVPEGDAATLFLELRRHGAPPAGYRGDASVELSLPAAEVEAVVALLAGVAAQARRDGALPPRAP